MMGSDFKITGHGDNLSAYRSVNYMDKKFGRSRFNRDVKMMAHGMGSYSTLAETSVADAEEDQAQTDAVLERKGDNKF